MVVAEIGPKYKLISNKLKNQILKGEFQPGHRLPSEITLAKQFGVSRIITRQAVQVLEKEGFVSRRRGSGTFVNTLGADAKPIKKLEHLAFVLIDSLPSEDYYLLELHRAEHWLASHNVTLSIGTLSSEDLVNGKLPPVLRNELTQGVLFDGVVQEFHLKIARQLDLPFLVVGDHPIGREYPQIKFACKQIAGRSVDFLYKLNDQPVLILLEPFRLHFTKELYAGYSQAVAKYDQVRPILQTCDDDGYTGMHNLLKQGYKKFSLITTDKMLRGVLQVYAEQSISIEENPILTIGNPRRLSAWERRETYLAPLSAEHIALEASRLFMDMYKQNDFSVYVELDVQIEGRRDL